MSRDVHARAEAFLATFLAPLLEGGPVLIGAPLTPAMADHFIHMRSADPEIDQVIFQATRAWGSELTPATTLPHPDPGTMVLAMASHNLLALTDPALRRFMSRRAIPAITAFAESLLDLAHAPATRGQALSRHALISRLFAIRRRDIVVKNWAYTYRFFGRPVPSRVLALPNLRLVRQRAGQRGLLSLLHEIEVDGHTPGISKLFSRALMASPITDLLRPDLHPDAGFGLASLAVLSDLRLRGAIARSLSAMDPQRVGHRLGRGLVALMQQPAPAPLLQVAIALAFETLATAALDGNSAFFSLDGLDEDSKLCMAVLPAIIGVDADITELPLFEPSDLHELRRVARALDAGLPRELLKMAFQIVDQAAWRPPPTNGLAHADLTPAATP